MKSPDGTELFIEICNTHPVTQEKIDSGTKIIELEIEEEGDLEHLFGKRTFTDGYNATFYNFSSVESVSRFQSCQRHAEWKNREELKANVAYLLMQNFKHRQREGLDFNLYLPKKSICVDCELGPCPSEICKQCNLAKHFDIQQGDSSSELMLKQIGGSRKVKIKVTHKEDTYISLDVDQISMHTVVIQVRDYKIDRLWVAEMGDFSEGDQVKFFGFPDKEYDHKSSDCERFKQYELKKQQEEIGEANMMANLDKIRQSWQKTV